MNEFDELLNEVLKQEVQGEPLTGLEQRVLNRVQQSSRERTTWLWGTGVTATAALMAAILVSAMDRTERSERALTGHPLAAVPQRIAPVQTASLMCEAGERESSPTPPRGVYASPRRHNLRRGAGEAALPKLETFPARTQQPRHERGGWEVLPGSTQEIQALADLKQRQSEPIRIAEIEIKPLMERKAEQ
jgi:hypothetical protein